MVCKYIMKRPSSPFKRIRKWSISESAAKRKWSSICRDLNGQSMNNPELCFSVQIGRHCVAVSVRLLKSGRDRATEEWGFIRPISITQWSKIFAMPGGIWKNIWKKKFNILLTFYWAFVHRFTLRLLWLQVREDRCLCIKLWILNHVNLFHFLYWCLCWNLLFHYSF